MKKNNLDERQEQKLLQIEHNGCWLAFWGLLIAMAVQMVIDVDIRTLAGEWIVFMILALYITVACIRNGIWDRRLKADRKTNLAVSIVAAIAAGAVFAVISYANFKAAAAAIATFVIVAIFVFISCFIALSISAKAYKDRLAKMESEYNEE